MILSYSNFVTYSYTILKLKRDRHVILLVLACATDSVTSEEPNAENSEVTNNIENDASDMPEELASTESDESNISDENKEEETATESSNTIPELPPEVLETMSEKEKRVYYAMIFGQNNMPTNKTTYDDENVFYARP